MLICVHISIWRTQRRKKLKRYGERKKKRNGFFCAMETLSNCCKRTWEMHSTSASVRMGTASKVIENKYWPKIQSKTALQSCDVSLSLSRSQSRSFVPSLTLSLSPLSALCMFYLIYVFFCLFIRVNICKSTFYGMPSIARKSICT